MDWKSALRLINVFSKAFGCLNSDIHGHKFVLRSIVMELFSSYIGNSYQKRDLDKSISLSALNSISVLQESCIP